MRISWCAISNIFLRRRKTRPVHLPSSRFNYQLIQIFDSLSYTVNVGPALIKESTEEKLRGVTLD